MGPNELSAVVSLVQQVINGNECTREFEVELTKLVNSLSDETDLLALLKSTDEKRKFVGVYGLFIYYRHLMEYDKLENLFDSSKELFDQYHSLGHLRTIFYIDSDAYYSSDEIMQHLCDASDVINHYRRIEKQSPDKQINLAGVEHAFADLFATYCERYESLQESIIAKWYKRALSAVDSAIHHSPEYAKYYCTRGRILALANHYDAALDEIQKAIRVESPSGNKENYSLRIMQYQSHKLNVQAKYQIYKLKSQQEKLNEDIGKMKSSLISNIEIIGFFSGIISFIIGSLTLANGETAKDAASLIIVLFGALLVVLDGFSFLLHSERKHFLKYIIILVIGVAIIIGGLHLVL